MNLRTFSVLFLAVFLAAAPAQSHPAPFSYIDLHIGPDFVDMSLVAHIFDVAHDLPVVVQDRLLEPAFLAAQSTAIADLFGARVHLSADGQIPSRTSWSMAEPLPERQAIRLRARFHLKEAPGVVRIDVRMFPYDPAHQTFVNIYQGETLALQAILDSSKPDLEYYSGSRQGAVAVARRFTPAGVRHVLFGADHLVFLAGLLLLGGSVRQVGRMVGALAAANALAWLLTWLHLMHPPARTIEPALALCIVYLGADNLLVRDGRDMRVWIAFAFGFIHGFWFAAGLQAMDLPSATLGWSLLAFDAGVEAAQVVVLIAAGAAVTWLGSRLPTAARRLVVAGSVGSMLAGAYWFVQRVFFPAGVV